PEYALASPVRERVIQRGGEIQHHGTRDEDADADDESGAADAHRVGDEQRARHEHRRESNAMTDAVGDLFAKGLPALDEFRNPGTRVHFGVNCAAIVARNSRYRIGFAM